MPVIAHRIMMTLYLVGGIICIIVPFGSIFMDSWSPLLWPFNLISTIGVFSVVGGAWIDFVHFVEKEKRHDDDRNTSRKR